MRGYGVIFWLLAGALSFSAEPPSDLLRFGNGDQLHGQFQGLAEGGLALWRRQDVVDPVPFKTNGIRHVVLRGGRPLQALSSLSHVALVNGDRVPGTLSALDAEALTVETAFAGALRIPREQVVMLAPNPLGGRLHYHGPFIEEEWKMAHAAFPAGIPHTENDADDADTEVLAGTWLFSGSAWYWPGKKSGTALIRQDGMPDRSILRFDLAWRNRLSLAVAFHADFAKIRPAKEAGGNDAKEEARPIGFVPGDSTVLPVLFGNSYVLQIFATHMMLFRSSIDEEGAPKIERVQVNGNAVRLGDTGKATLEIRSNRLSGQISLFVNDEFIVQWSERAEAEGAGNGYAGRGNGFGFVVQTEDAPVKISDVMVAEWNGMPDSARSLQVDAQDVVLLANGTDRFAGKVISLEGGKLDFEGKFGRFQFQLDEVAEIRFARDGLVRQTEPAADELILRFSPLGQISARPLAGTHSNLKLLSQIYGEIDCKLDAAVMLDFQATTTIIDDWESEF
jgi:hypothetical protein